MKVKMNYPDCNHFTPGKVYETTEECSTGFYVKDDNGVEQYCLLRKCPHLNFNDWIIVKGYSNEVIGVGPENYYGGLQIKQERGKFYWSCESYNGDNWKEISEESYLSLRRVAQEEDK
ncbi:MAG: hypothetical protein [Caudoviricetes sp.]|nr:MAG: hypothetical protein [Caudoviricetes sp.]